MTADGEDLIEDRDSDSDFVEEKELDQEKDLQIWDDEENFIQEDDEEREEEGPGSDEANDQSKDLAKSDMSIDQNELQAKLSEMSANTSQKDGE